MVNPLSYFSFQPVLHDVDARYIPTCVKGCGMCYPLCGAMHIKEQLLLVGKCSPCSDGGFLFSLSELSFITFDVILTINKMC